VLLSTLPALAYIGLVVYSLIDCLQTPAEQLRRLGHGGWIMVMVLLPVLGALAWLLLGTPRTQRRHARAGAGPADGVTGYGWTEEGLAQRPIGPDDDPEFLAGLGQARRDD
jgi:Phospholipase_D-nuclease N-terminal